MHGHLVLPAWSLRGGAFVALLAACSSEHHALQPGAADGAVQPGVAPAQTSDAGNSPSAGAHSGPFRVQLSLDPDATRVCRGSCVTLNARAAEGVPPYHYEFDQGLGSGAGPHRVCPNQTTTYGVRVSDSSFDPEFGGMNAPVRSDVTVVVEACGDAALPPALDAGASDAGSVMPPKPMRDSGVGPSGTIACQKTIASATSANETGGGFDGNNELFTHKLIADANADALFALAFAGNITLSDGAKQAARSLSGAGVLVGKVGPDCSLIWCKGFTGKGTANLPRLAVDSKGRAIVLSGTAPRAGGSPDGAGAISLQVFSPAGEPVWEKQFNRLYGEVYEGAVRTDANDDIVIIVSADQGLDLGGGPLGTDVPGTYPSIVALAKFSASGAYLWSKLLQEEGAVPTLAIQNGTDILFHARSSRPLSWGAAGTTRGAQPGGGHGYLVRADAAGNYVWSKVVGELGEGRALDEIDVNVAGQLVQSSFPGAGELTLTSPDASDVIWSKRVLDPSDSYPGWWNKTSSDANANLFLGGMYFGMTTVSQVPISADNLSAFIQKLAPDGGLRWTYVLPRPTDPATQQNLIGLTTDGQGGVLALTSRNDNYRRELSVLRLFP